MIAVFAAATIAFGLYVDRCWMGPRVPCRGGRRAGGPHARIPAATYKLVAFAIGTAIAGLAGGLYAYFTQFVVPDTFGFILSVTLIAMVVIGGAGSTWGRRRGDDRPHAPARGVPFRQRLPVADFRRPPRPRHALCARRSRRPLRVGGAAAATHMTDALAVTSIAVSFGGVHALRDVSFSIAPGDSSASSGRTVLARRHCSRLSPVP